jgi:hypothetical protein
MILLTWLLHSSETLQGAYHLLHKPSNRRIILSLTAIAHLIFFKFSAAGAYQEPGKSFKKGAFSICTYPNLIYLGSEFHFWRSLLGWTGAGSALGVMIHLFATTRKGYPGGLCYSYKKTQATA